jgi:hypothetical protein
VRHALGRSVPAAVWIAISMSGSGARAAHSDPDRSGNRDPRVALELVACPDPLKQAVRRIVGIEIGDLLIEEGSVVANIERLTIRCNGDVAWIDAGSDERAVRVDHLDRTLRLNDFPSDAVPRAVALAAIEELAALSPAVRKRVQERRPPAAPVVARSAGPVTGPSDGIPRVLQVQWRIELSAIARAFVSSSGLIVYGAGAGFTRDSGHRVLVAFDMDVAGGNRTVSLGEVRGRQLSAGVFAGARAGAPNLSAAVAIGARFGLVQFAGKPVDAATTRADSVLRPWGGPVASMRAFAGSGALSTSFALEAGIALVGAEGLVDRAATSVAHGPWVMASLGIGIRHLR